MEGTPTFLDYTDILEVFMQVDGVVRVHNLRLWGLTANKSALSAHLAIGKLLFLLIEHRIVLKFNSHIFEMPKCRRSGCRC